jgi:hypothetical protein
MSRRRRHLRPRQRQQTEHERNGNRKREPNDQRCYCEGERWKARDGRSELRPSEYTLREALFCAQTRPGSLARRGQGRALRELRSQRVVVVVLKLAQVAAHVARGNPRAQQALA